jgi:hypothetical protein
MSASNSAKKQGTTSLTPGICSGAADIIRDQVRGYSVLVVPDFPSSINAVSLVLPCASSLCSTTAEKVSIIEGLSG